MRKSLLIMWCLLSLPAMLRAQVSDAFHGVLPVTDPQMKKSLNGVWQLKVVDGIVPDMRVPAPDTTFKSIPVPGCWEAYGFCQPSYDTSRPLTGYYRTTFTVPEAWRGQRIILRFDGVLYGYDLWINGKAAGSWRSAYNTAMFDITSCLNKRSSRQELAMKVISKFPGSDFDCNDDWAPNGIFRDVTLMAVPKTHLKDLTIRTSNTGEVTVSTEVANGDAATVVRHEICDAAGRVVGTDRVDHPHLWTAETPYLYTLRTTLLQKGRVMQTFSHRFGFRELTVDGNVLKLNGQPVKLRGVTSHATDPVTVKVISEVSILRDMRMMKEASVNYIRTSHYPREPRFYELADSLGFYVIDEVPFGFGDKNLSDPAFLEVLQQRAQATVRRDKNHPCVLIWSLGNENPLTDICVRLGDYVKQHLDPSRPICYPQVGSYFRRFNYQFPRVADIYTPHYPTTSQIAGFYQRADRPVVFTEYCHTLGVSFEDHDRQWELIERTPCIAGGSVWEWADQGMPFCLSDPVAASGAYGYEERVFTTARSGFAMCGNKGADGLLYADRTPLPNYYELQRNYARAFVSDVEGDVLHIVNRFDFINLKDHVTFRWALTNNRDTVMRGAFSPDCAARGCADYLLSLPELSGLALLHVDITDHQGHTFLRQTFVRHKPQVEWGGSGNPQQFVRARSVRVGRKPTMAERLKQKGRLPLPYLLPLDNTQVRACVQTDSIAGGQQVSFTLTPDTADVFRAELGVALLLDASVDRVQWMGQGPFTSYPGRQRANRYGLWSKRAGDLYFEGNRMGVDAAYLSDAQGNGLLIVGDSLSLNFEQTDRGIVVTVNADVAGQGPKFARTHFPPAATAGKEVHASFRLYGVRAGSIPPAVRQLFAPPQTIPAPFRPFETQYDTYLMRYDEIAVAEVSR
ncbi:MAG: hypothetical protein K5764_05170 [Prevotella sp.]|nr:hypothetical protein [Prevotella sp.]